MMIGFSKYSTGNGAAAGLYMTSPVDSKRQERIPPPEVVRGDMHSTVDLIKSIENERTYSSGVLSFEPGEIITPEMEQDIMDRFEATAFAGMERDQYDITWTRHTHAGHHELHFLTPRMELSTGLALNIKPPGEIHNKIYDRLRTDINIQYDLADPDDPRRRQGTSLPDWVRKIRAIEGRLGKEVKKEFVEDLGDLIRNDIEMGKITSRKDVVDRLSGAGFGVREGWENQKHLSISYNDANGDEQKVRLKGAYYEREFDAARAYETAARERDKTTARGAGARSCYSNEDHIRIKRELENCVESRSRYYRETYKRKQREITKNRGARQPETARAVEQEHSGHQQFHTQKSGENSVIALGTYLDCELGELGIHSISGSRNSEQFVQEFRERGDNERKDRSGIRAADEVIRREIHGKIERDPSYRSEDSEVGVEKEGIRANEQGVSEKRNPRRSEEKVGDRARYRESATIHQTPENVRDIQIPRGTLTPSNSEVKYANRAGKTFNRFIEKFGNTLRRAGKAASAAITGVAGAIAGLGKAIQGFDGSVSEVNQSLLRSRTAHFEACEQLEAQISRGRGWGISLGGEEEEEELEL